MFWFINLFEDFLKKFKDNKQNTTDNILEKIRRVDIKFRQVFFDYIQNFLNEKDRNLYSFLLAQKLHYFDYRMSKKQKELNKSKSNKKT